MPDPLQTAKNWLTLIQEEALANVYKEEPTRSHAPSPHPLDPGMIYHLATTGLQEVAKQEGVIWQPELVEVARRALEEFDDHGDYEAPVQALRDLLAAISSKQEAALSERGPKETAARLLTAGKFLHEAKEADAPKGS